MGVHKIGKQLKDGEDLGEQHKFPSQYEHRNNSTIRPSNQSLNINETVVSVRKVHVGRTIGNKDIHRFRLERRSTDDK